MVTFGIVSGWALNHVANQNPAIFPVPQCTEKRLTFFTEKLIKFFYLNFSAPGNFSTQIILTCCTCLKITFILISEQPKTSGFLVMLSEWFNRTKVSHNWILTGCLAVKLRSKFETESSQPYFYLVFVGKKQ